MSSYNEKLLLSEAGIFEVPRKDALFTKILNERKWHRRKVQLLGKLINLAVTDCTFYLYTPAATRKSLKSWSQWMQAWQGSYFAPFHFAQMTLINHLKFSWSIL